MKMLVLLSLLAFSTFAHEVEGNVLVLTDANYEDALKENPFIFIKFYAPWCGHCKRLAPDWEKAATALKERGSSVRIAKMDCTVETVTCGKNNVRGYPSLNWFENGQQVNKYAGKRNVENIIEYALMESGED